jgi:DNA-binding response OmpR family regulator
MQAPLRPRSAESNSRVLYLGSDLELVAALRKMLTEPDYQLVTCSDLESAILFLKSGIPYHLLLIDIEWRGREGLKVARLAHSLRHRKRMPIILVAKKLSSHVKGLARKAGVNECVMKTGEMAAACKAIRQMIERKE